MRRTAQKVYVWGRMVVPPAQDDAFRELIDELVTTMSRSDPGTVSMGVFEIPAEPGCYLVQEVYADAEAQWGHLQNVGALLGRIAELGVVMEGFNVAGEPLPQARVGLDAFGVAYWPIVTELHSPARDRGASSSGGQRRPPDL